MFDAWHSTPRACDVGRLRVGSYLPAGVFLLCVAWWYRGDKTA